MLVLRLTSPEAVVGRETDDGFVIGQVTVAGTYNLLVLGAAVGFIGAAAYVAVAPWLVGPALGAGRHHRRDRGGPGGLDAAARRRARLHRARAAVAGDRAVRRAARRCSACLLAYAVERVEEPDHWSARGQRRGQVPVLVLLLFVPALVVVVPVAVVVAALLPLRRALLEPLRRSCRRRPGWCGAASPPSRSSPSSPWPRTCRSSWGDAVSAGRRRSRRPRRRPPR